MFTNGSLTVIKIAKLTIRVDHRLLAKTKSEIMNQNIIQ